MKIGTPYIVFAAVAVLLIVLAELARPDPTDWSYDMSRYSRAPYGAYILHHFLEDAFAGHPVSGGAQDMATTIMSGPLDGLTYLLIDQEFVFDPFATEWMLDDADSGISFFLSAFDVTGPLADSLGFKTDRRAGSFRTVIEGDFRLADSLRFEQPAPGTPDAYVFDRRTGWHYFDSVNVGRTAIIARDGEDRPIYIRVERGEGAFYVNLTPLAFSNFFLLNDETRPFAFEALAYLPRQAVYWDEYYKPAYRAIQSPLRFILRTESLRWAYYTALSFVFLFMLFHARRRQRIIPVVEPKKNVTLDFVRTISRLYFGRGDYKSLAEKRIAYLLNYIRTRLNVRAETLDVETAKHVADRSGVEREKVEQLFAMIERLRKQESMNHGEMNHLNELIEDFYELSAR